MAMRKFAIGDIHGNYSALIQCLKLVNFDYQKDQLISLGDVCDGKKETHLVVDELMKILNLIFILGNHDKWFIDYLRGVITKDDLLLWINQGGAATFSAYNSNREYLERHGDFWLTKPKLFHLDETIWNGVAFVHGGINSMRNLEDQTEETLLWDRNLYRLALHSHEIEYSDKRFTKVFVGHTEIRSQKPLITKSLINLDTGAGSSGVLTIMNIETLEYWQSK